MRCAPGGRWLQKGSRSGEPAFRQNATHTLRSLDASPLPQQYLESVLRPRQLQHLQAQWEVYQERVEAARRQAREAVLQSQWSLALSAMGWSRGLARQGSSTVERAEVRDGAPGGLGCLARGLAWADTQVRCLTSPSSTN